MEGLIAGRIVHYVLNEGRSKGDHRPAIVVRDWSKPDIPDTQGMVNLQVFIDGTNDFDYNDLRSHQGALWATSIHYSEAKELGTWHWIEKA